MCIAGLGYGASLRGYTCGPGPYQQKCSHFKQYPTNMQCQHQFTTKCLNYKQPINSTTKLVRTNTILIISSVVSIIAQCKSYPKYDLTLLKALVGQILFSKHFLLYRRTNITHSTNIQILTRFLEHIFHSNEQIMLFLNSKIRAQIKSSDDGNKKYAQYTTALLM